MQAEVLRRKTRELMDHPGRTVKRLGAAALLGTTLFINGCAAAATPRAGETQAPASPVPATVAPTQPRQGHAEVEQFGAYVFDNYQNASGEGQYLQIGQQVAVECIEYDPNTTVASTRGLWYQLVTPKGSRGEVVYAAANTFWNQAPPQPPDQDNAYDPTIPLCPDSPSKTLPPLHP